MSISVILFMIIGVLCTLYGVMILLIHSGTAFYAVWFALAAFFLVLAFLVHSHSIEKIPKMLRTILLIAICAGALMLAVCEFFVLRGFGSRAPADLDYLIVLGAQVREDGPSVVLKYRLFGAYSLLSLCALLSLLKSGEFCAEDEISLRRNIQCQFPSSCL